MDHIGKVATKWNIIEWQLDYTAEDYLIWKRKLSQAPFLQVMSYELVLKALAKQKKGLLDDKLMCGMTEWEKAKGMFRNQ